MGSKNSKVNPETDSLITKTTVIKVKSKEEVPLKKEKNTKYKVKRKQNSVAPV